MLPSVPAVGGTQQVVEPDEVVVTEVEHAVVISLFGEHDLSTAQRLQEAYDDATGRGSAIVFDLSSATFIDSSVIGILLRAAREATPARPPVALVAPASGAPAHVIDVLGLDGVLAVFETRIDALHATSSPQ